MCYHIQFFPRLFYFEFEDNFRVQIPGGLYLEERFIGRFFALRVCGLIFGGAYFPNFAVSMFKPNLIVVAWLSLTKSKSL